MIAFHSPIFLRELDKTLWSAAERRQLSQTQPFYNHPVFGNAPTEIVSGVQYIDLLASSRFNDSDRFLCGA